MLSSLKQSFVEDKQKNLLVKDLGIATLFLVAAVLFLTTPLKISGLFPHLIGVCIGFALGYGIRSMRAVRGVQR